LSKIYQISDVCFLSQFCADEKVTSLNVKTPFFGSHACRLIAEKINKNERKGKSEIEVFTPGSETAAFWRALNVQRIEDVKPIQVSEDLRVTSAFNSEEIKPQTLI